MAKALFRSRQIFKFGLLRKKDLPDGRQAIRKIKN
jgi:hypothetical protein